VLGVDGGWVQFTCGAAIDSPPWQCSIFCGNTREAHIITSKRKWAPQITRDTPKGVQKPSINVTEPFICHWHSYCTRARFTTLR